MKRWIRRAAICLVTRSLSTRMTRWPRQALWTRTADKLSRVYCGGWGPLMGRGCCWRGWRACCWSLVRRTRGRPGRGAHDDELGKAPCKKRKISAPQTFLFLVSAAKTRWSARAQQIRCDTYCRRFKRTQLNPTERRAVPAIEHLRCAAP